MLVAGALVYVGARLFAEIHVEAKALAVIAPLVLLVGLRALLAPAGERAQQAAQARLPPGTRFGVLVAGRAALGSTLLALRAAPVGFDDRQAGLERLAERIEGDIGRLPRRRPLRRLLPARDAGARAGRIRARGDRLAARRSAWQQGLAVDFDTLDAGKLDKFRLRDHDRRRPTPRRAPRELRAECAREGDYVLWRAPRRDPAQPDARARAAPRASFDCGAAFRSSAARSQPSVLAPTPVVVRTRDVDPAGAGRGPRRAARSAPSLAPGEATARPRRCPRPASTELSLQYHSQVPLQVARRRRGGRRAAALARRHVPRRRRAAAAFWPAGELERAGPARSRSTVEPPRPRAGFSGALGVERRVWLGDLAATPGARPERAATSPTPAARYVDHFTLQRGGERPMTRTSGSPAEAPSPVLGGGEIDRAARARAGRLRRRHRAQRHPRARTAALAPRALRRSSRSRSASTPTPTASPACSPARSPPSAFVKRLRGFWWKGFQTNRMRGMYRFVDRDRFDAAVERFEASHADDLEAACRDLFFDLLWFRASRGREGGGGRGADRAEHRQRRPGGDPDAPLSRGPLHPRRPRRPRRLGLAGRPDPRPDPPPHPRRRGSTGGSERIRGDRGTAPARSRPSRLLTVSLDELLLMPRARAALRPLFRFLGAPVTKRTRRYFRNRMTSEEANAERWRRGISARQGGAHRARSTARRSTRLEADGRAARRCCATRFERRAEPGRAAGLCLRSRLRMSPRPTLPPDLVFVGGTGRSGTHILSYLLDRHSRFHGVPIECRFHCNPKGLADVVTGRTDARRLPAQAARLLVAPGADRRPRLREGASGARSAARRGARTAHDHLRPSAFEQAVARFEATHGDDLLGASRTLFYDLLAAAGRRGRQAGPGRDELLHDRRRRRARADLPRGALRALGPRRARLGLLEGLAAPEAPPPDRRRLRDRVLGRPPAPGRAGVRGLSAADRERLRVISLDELVWTDREAAYAELLRVPRVDDEPGDARVLRYRDERRRRPPRALAQGPRPTPEQERDRRASTSATLERLEPRATTARRCCAAPTSASAPPTT